MLAWHRATVSAARVSVPQGAELTVPGDCGGGEGGPSPPELSARCPLSQHCSVGKGAFASESESRSCCAWGPPSAAGTRFSLDVS